MSRARARAGASRPDFTPRSGNEGKSLSQTDAGHIPVRDSDNGPIPPFDADPRVDAYIDALPDWQQAICHEVRALVHAADPELSETIKRTRQPYFVLQGNVCALLATKDHVNVFLYDGAIVPDPEQIITGGHDNKTARTMAVYRGDTINAGAFTAMIRQIIANNRAGGWRALKRAAE